MSERELAGGCQCGRVRYRISVEPVMAAICHCTRCRRANAAPAVAWAMFHKGSGGLPEDAPASYPSSPEARRGFCRVCGTQISFTADYLSSLIDIAIGSLDQPEPLAPCAALLAVRTAAVAAPRRRPSAVAEFPPIA